MKHLTIALALGAVFLAGSEAQAQQARDTEVRQELRTMVIQGDDARSDRAVVADFLEREDVRRVAAEQGVDLDRVQDGVRTLGAEEAGQLAERVRDVQDQLAGGDTFVIGSTTVIIALLVIILILVA